MTLKISDLSVGDWVECEGLHHPITFVGYGEGGDGSLVNLIRPDLSCFSCKISDIHPIPITAEILEKNGFGKKTFTQDQLLRIVEPNGSRPFICYRWDSRRVIIERCNDYMLRVKAEYIHQLQHALRIAGVEKEINL